MIAQTPTAFSSVRQPSQNRISVSGGSFMQFQGGQRVSMFANQGNGGLNYSLMDDQRRMLSLKKLPTGDMNEMAYAFPQDIGFIKSSLNQLLSDMKRVLEHIDGASTASSRKPKKRADEKGSKSQGSTPPDTPPQRGLTRGMTYSKIFEEGEKQTAKDHSRGGHSAVKHHVTGYKKAMTGISEAQEENEDDTALQKKRDDQSSDSSSSFKTDKSFKNISESDDRERAQLEKDAIKMKAGEDFDKSHEIQSQTSGDVTVKIIDEMQQQNQSTHEIQLYYSHNQSSFATTGQTHGITGMGPSDKIQGVIEKYLKRRVSEMKTAPLLGVLQEFDMRQNLEVPSVSTSNIRLTPKFSGSAKEVADQALIPQTSKSQGSSPQQKYYRHTVNRVESENIRTTITPDIMQLVMNIKAVKEAKGQYHPKPQLNPNINQYRGSTLEINQYFLGNNNSAITPLRIQSRESSVEEPIQKNNDQNPYSNLLKDSLISPSLEKSHSQQNSYESGSVRYSHPPNLGINQISRPQNDGRNIDQTNQSMGIDYYINLKKNQMANTYISIVFLFECILEIFIILHNQRGIQAQKNLSVMSQWIPPQFKSSSITLQAKCPSKNLVSSTT